MKYLSVFLLSVFLLFSCSSDDNFLFPPVDATTVRLKHLLTTSEVVGALGGYTNGWDVRELDVTNEGSYPNFPYIYYYRLSMTIEASGGTPTQGKSVYAQAGGGVNADVTLEQFLEEHDGYVAVSNPKLATYPRTYVVKKSDNNNDSWVIDLYTPHIAKDGNKTMHSIHLSGSYIPPPSDEIAVEVMLGLLEKHD